MPWGANGDSLDTVTHAEVVAGLALKGAVKIRKMKNVKNETWETPLDARLAGGGAGGSAPESDITPTPRPSRRFVAF
jgi:hypothetical protein